MALGLYLYCAALLAQFMAAIYALNLYREAKSHHTAAGFLAIGFALMLLRRIHPIYVYLEDGRINTVDAWLSLAVSFSLLIGAFHIKQIWQGLESKNFLLNQNLKEDSLTGVLSRAETFNRSLLEIERSFRTKDPVSFLMLDIDHFKRINDRFGHQLGDTVLKNLCKICQAELRTVDIFGRVGGEEFLIVLPQTGHDGALEVAERLRSFIASKSCGSSVALVGTNVEPEDVVITVCVGVATFNPLGDQERQAQLILKKYYDLCDKAMYHAKQDGRNCISA